MPSQARDVYSSAFFALELDGKKDAVSNLRSIEGGGVKADVINYQMGSAGAIWRQLGKPKYDDIKLTAGLASSGDLWAWMKHFMEGHPERRNGAIIAGDYSYISKARRVFYDALISSIDFPKWDSGDKNPANVSVTISPERITYEPGDGETIDQPDPTETTQRHVACCNFEFEIQGFEDVCGRVAKVDAFSVKMKIIDHVFGSQLHAHKIPGKLEMPNLVFYLPEVDAEQFRTHHFESIMRGQRGPGRTAALRFYNNGQQEQGSFSFSGVHIFNVSAEKHDASSEDVKLTKVECAVEGIVAELGKIGAQPAP